MLRHDDVVRWIEEKAKEIYGLGAEIIEANDALIEAQRTVGLPESDFAKDTSLPDSLKKDADFFYEAASWMKSGSGKNIKAIVSFLLLKGDLFERQAAEFRQTPEQLDELRKKYPEIPSIDDQIAIKIREVTYCRTAAYYLTKRHTLPEYLMNAVTQAMVKEQLWEEITRS
jgi:hypothetical protein